MTTNEFQASTKRTSCDYLRARSRMMGRTIEQADTTEPDLTAVEVNHLCIGIGAEAGELLSEIQRWIYYGQPLNEVNLKEELGDLMWYVSQLCNRMGWSLSSVIAANISKLKARYPEKFTEELAKEENRDRVREAEMIRTTDSGK